MYTWILYWREDDSPIVEVEVFVGDRDKPLVTKRYLMTVFGTSKQSDDLRQAVLTKQLGWRCFKEGCWLLVDAAWQNLSLCSSEK